MKKPFVVGLNEGFGTPHYSRWIKAFGIQMFLSKQHVVYADLLDL